MKRIIFLVVIFVSLAVVHGCRKSKSDIVYDRKYIKEIKELRKEIFLFMNRNYIPGGNYAISIKGKTIYSEGLGQASTDLEVPVTRKTKFRIGETTEILTALTFRLMAEKGILDPDSSVYHYFPDFSKK